MVNAAEKCSACLENDMVEITINPEAGSFMVCSNCDSPKGKYKTLGEIEKKEEGES